MNEENTRKGRNVPFSDTEWADLGKIAQSEGTNRCILLRQLLAQKRTKWIKAQKRGENE